jgi:hypothetical protein
MMNKGNTQNKDERMKTIRKTLRRVLSALPSCTPELVIIDVKQKEE